MGRAFQGVPMENHSDPQAVCPLWLQLAVRDGTGNHLLEVAMPHQRSWPPTFTQVHTCALAQAVLSLEIDL